MKRIARHSRLLLLFFLCTFSFASFSQDVTGIWKGYFISSDGQHYRLEFQVKQNSGGQVAVTGVSYSWQDDIKFYGKATMTGSFVKTSKNFRIKEIKTVEVKSATGFGTCIMNYELVYSRSGKEEFLEGSYLGKPEVKGRPNPYEWGECGTGTVYLRKVVTSDFYIEPFLRKKSNTTIPLSPRRDSIARRNPPVINKKTTVTTNPQHRKDVVRVNPPQKQRPDTLIKPVVPVIKEFIKTDLPTPAILKQRSNELMKSLVVNNPDVTVRLYDNGEIDDDSISIFFDKKLLFSNKRLSAAPILLKLNMDEENVVHELVMVAENLGRIPPNTALMVVDAGDQRFDVRITSTEQKNALVRFRYEKPK